MANIIEQQDLLKGLPDNRLALLMKSPNADIPPFLVAAEAQRRQSIRQQFAGQGSQESVVDTLTKQMANVPQNVQAPMQTPPSIPPAPQPDQGGIAAIQPQQMASGGPVRRFAGEGYVAPTVDSVSADYFQDPLGTPSTQEAASEGFSMPDLFGGIGSYVTEGLQNLKNSPVPRWQTEEEARKRFAEEHPTGMSDVESQKEISTLTNRIPPKKPDPGKKDTSPENKGKSAYDYSGLPPEFRDRLEKMYAAEEPSNWEEAQKWFGMSAQLMNPNASLMQGIANAGLVYSQAEGDQAQAKREADINLQKALLDYDVNEYTDKRDFEQAQYNAQIAAEQKMQERMTPTAGNVMDFYSAQIKAASAEIAAIDADMSLTDEQKVAAKKEIKDRINALAGSASMLMRNSGYSASDVVTEDQLRAAAGQG